MNSAEAVIVRNTLEVSEALITNDFSKVIFSYTTTPSGKLLVLSSFSDDVWIIPDSQFTTSVTKSFKRLNFKTVPSKFVHILKLCVLKYSLFGLFGQPPRGSTIKLFFTNALSFLNYISKHTDSLNAINPLLFSNYTLDTKLVKGRKEALLTVDALRLRFTGVEQLHLLSQDTVDPMRHPWPDSSASTLSGKNGTDWYLKGKTPVIPDDILAVLFQQSVSHMERAEYLIELRDASRQIISTLTSRGNQTLYTSPFLQSQGFEGGLREVLGEIRKTYIACAVIILTTSGVRIHELHSLKEDCRFTTEDSDGKTIYWMRGRSEKTGEGDTEWVVTEATHQAISVAAKITAPLREELKQKIDELFSVNADCHIAAQLSLHKDVIFLGKHTVTGEISTLANLGNLLTGYCTDLGLDWNLTSHQFRRTFAVYVVRSAHGDLRYLKKHFKHWSLDMTALYAANEQKDSDLLDELMQAYSEAKESIIDHMLDETTLLSGGLADGVMKFRAAQIKTYQDRSEMVKTVADFVHIRATSVAWCTNDLGNCVGGSGLEATRCGDCVNSLIDDTKLPVWQGIYDQQIELLDLTDIGESGLERVRRDVARCEKVLKDLGAPVEMTHG